MDHCLRPTFEVSRIPWFGIAALLPAFKKDNTIVEIYFRVKVKLFKNEDDVY